MDEFTPSGPERQQEPTPPTGADDPAATNGRYAGGADSGPLAAAQAYRAAGLSVIPIRRDGSKRPNCGSWKSYQQEPADEAQVRKWFDVESPPGVAVIGGDVSGGLECLDFDAEAETIFREWCALVEDEAPGLVARLSVARTPKGGYHVRFRCPDMPIPGNTKLATDPAAKAVLIETRGEGGYALAPGCPAECHPTGRLYLHHGGPILERVQAIGFAERDILIRCARSFDRSAPPEPTKPRAGRGPGLSPGDDYDQRGPDWPALLEPHGWVAIRHRGAATYWRRPGKDGPGWSATTGGCTSRAGRALFYVFSSNALPFELGKGYSKFATYALLNHGGDFSAAARALAEQGYGERQGRRSSNGTARGHAAGAGDPQDDDTPTGEEPELPPGEDGAPKQPAPSKKGAQETAEQGKTAHFTDTGNAQRFRRRHGANDRYCDPWGKWLCWDGKRWRVDDTQAAKARAKETVLALFDEAAKRVADIAGRLKDVADEREEAKLKAALALEQADPPALAVGSSRKTRNPSAFPGVSRGEPVLSPQARQGISSESHPTAVAEQLSAPHPTPTRQGRPPRLLPTHAHRQQHPL